MVLIKIVFVKVKLFVVLYYYFCEITNQFLVANISIQFIINCNDEVFILLGFSLCVRWQTGFVFSCHERIQCVFDIPALTWTANLLIYSFKKQLHQQFLSLTALIDLLICYWWNTKKSILSNNTFGHFRISDIEWHNCRMDCSV